MKIHSLDTGLFKLDGGAMFGVVPRSMWQKLSPPDANNMCTWAMRCLLVEDGNKLVLIDNGLGDKMDDKLRGHLYLHGNDTLEKSLQKLGFTSADITDVFLTHLHLTIAGVRWCAGPMGRCKRHLPMLPIGAMRRIGTGLRTQMRAKKRAF